MSKTEIDFTGSLSGRFIKSASNLKRSRDEIDRGKESKKDELEAFGGTRPVSTFERLNRIGQGTYGTVYRAIDKYSKQMVALKKIILHNEQQDGFPLTSLRELRLLKRIKHKNCVRLIEVAVSKDRDGVFLVFEYCEHDLSTLLDSMKTPFSEAEVKGLIVQLFRAIKYLHDNWIIHRDLKMSNLLYDCRGCVKLCDFGLARLYGEPPRPMTPKVVTLWYRPPELLLGCVNYGTSVDIWAAGCILGELLGHKPMMPGKNEQDQLKHIFKLFGSPSERLWPGLVEAPFIKSGRVRLDPDAYPYNNLPTQFPWLSKLGLSLLNNLMTYEPSKRLLAGEALNHAYFQENPYPKEAHLLPTFPSLHNQDDGNAGNSSG